MMESTTLSEFYMMSTSFKLVSQERLWIDLFAPRFLKRYNPLLSLLLTFSYIQQNYKQSEDK